MGGHTSPDMRGHTSPDIRGHTSLIAKKPICISAPTRSGQYRSHLAFVHRLATSYSSRPHNITIVRTWNCQTARQRSALVCGRGPCVTKYVRSRLLGPYTAHSICYNACVTLHVLLCISGVRRGGGGWGFEPPPPNRKKLL